MPGGGDQHLLLVDYGTAFHDLDVGARDRHRDRLVEFVTAAVGQERGARSRVEIRVYGGWLREGEVTTLHDQVAAALNDGEIFPLSNRSLGQTVFGAVTLAKSLLISPGVLLDQTLRPRPGLTRTSLHPDLDRDNCADQPNCTARSIMRYCRNSRRACEVADCGETPFTMFARFEQKMIDTMLTCDLLHAASSELWESITLISTDTDFIPPLLQASYVSNCPRIALIHPNTAPLSDEWRSIQNDKILVLGGT
jgi:hypothetical protein